MSRNELRCPVCDMKVTHADYTTVYLQMNLVFCSAQCQRAFSAHPHLYVGVPGQQAPRQQGRRILKRRRIRLARPLSAMEENIVRNIVSHLMGVWDATVEGDDIRISYDLLQVTEKQIEEALADAGVQLGSGWSERLRRGWVYYAEENQLDSMEVTPLPCCNQPPVARKT